MKKLLPAALLLLCLFRPAPAGVMEADKPAPEPTPEGTQAASDPLAGALLWLIQALPPLP